MRALPFIAIAAILGACDSPPDELVPGLDACEYCRMTVSDARFGGQVVTRTGKVLTFDAIECLASYVVGTGADLDRGRVRVADFETGRLIPVDSAVFIADGGISSPMGRALVAFSASHDAVALVTSHGGRSLTWDRVIELLRAQRLAPGAGAPDTVAHHHHHGIDR
jgi:copper chaperone NosL